MNKTAFPIVLAFSAIAAVVGAGVLAVLYHFDPSSNGFYPICFFHQTTGLLCPGCGSLRAVHQLLHGNIVQAFHFNQLLVLALPVGLAAGISRWIKHRRGESRAGNISGKWFWVCLGIGLAFSIWRNLPGGVFAAWNG